MGKYSAENIGKFMTGVIFPQVKESEEFLYPD